MLKNITFIIQGPLHSNSILNLFKYTTYGHVVFSCWDTCDVKTFEEEIKKHRYPKSTSIKIIVNDFPKHVPMEFRQNIPDESHIGGMYYQTITVHNALKTISTEWVIKIRSDEYYENWDMFIDLMVTNPKRLTTTNIFAFKHTCFPLHISDHVFGCKTSLLQKTYGQLYNHVVVNHLKSEISYQHFKEHLFDKIVQSDNLQDTPITFYTDVNTSEQLISIHFLYANYKHEILNDQNYSTPNNLQNARRIMHSFFEICPVQYMQPFMWSYKEGDTRKYVSNDEISLNRLYCNVYTIHDYFTSSTYFQYFAKCTRVGQYLYNRERYDESFVFLNTIPEENRTANIWLLLGNCKYFATKYTKNVDLKKEVFWFWDNIDENTEPVIHSRMMWNKLKAIENQRKLPFIEE